MMLSFSPIGDEKYATSLLFFSNLSIAIADVIVDSLMVVQARKDPERGAEDLNAYMWTMSASGGIVGSILAALLTDNFDPRYCFLFSAVMGLVISLTATRLNVALE